MDMEKDNLEEICDNGEAASTSIYTNEKEEDEEVYIPFGNLSVELTENSIPQESSNTLEDSESVSVSASVDCNPSDLIKEELQDDYLKLEEQDLTRKYFADFLYSNSPSENLGESSNSEFERKQLSKFPKIAKAIENSNVDTIGALYQLLFLRNAWDTHETLVQRILNFSGFNCEENSDDHFNREMMLHSLPDPMLLNIAAVLNIEHIKVKAEYFEKEKARLISLILKFLNKPPQAKKGQSKGAKSSTSDKADGTKTPVRRRRRKKSEFIVVKLPGAKSSPKKKKEEKTLKDKITSNLAVLLPEPIVILNKISPVVPDKPKEVQKPKNVDPVKPDESVQTVDKVKVSEPKKKRLRDYTSVTKCVRKTSEELLLDIHFLLFNEGGEIHKLKKNILEFDGFKFDSDSEEYDERREFLERMSDKTINDVTKTFSLEDKGSKDKNILHVLSFLKKPDESFIKVDENADGESSGLSDIDELDFEEMFESDDSITTCEVVSKKVECIDLISSGDESDKEKKVRKNQISLKKDPAPVVKSPAPVVKAPAPVVKVPIIVTPAETVKNIDPGRRTLKNFETICKIVNTHPDEYLVDIYDLLYLKKHEPRLLRKEILDFPGFDFLKGSQEYVKRKLLLDRMLYNSVRRIYNTLIHTTTEVKMFSKPAMITEIFEFLLKLPDTDTSIINMQQRINRQGVPPFASSATSNVTTPLVVGRPAVGVVTPPVSVPSQPGKLSDLKRVFQRVACFPCEYLLDVHKLLFMTDCDTKVIRQNIFGFKGFNFGVDSNEFQQRKMYLDYLTFHSLRKISSVLTTKTVDLRNSTKHELASHLTDVLAEYTNTYFDSAETTSSTQQNPPVPAEAASTPTTTVTQQSAANTTKDVSASTDSGVEKIVITPIIEPVCQTKNVSSSEPKPDLKSKENNKKQAQPISLVKSQTKPATSTTAKPKSTTPSAKRKRKVEQNNVEPESSDQAPDDSGQFSDINLPEVQSYCEMYGQSLNIYTPNVVNPQGFARAYSGGGILPQSVTHLVPQTMSVPIIHSVHSQSNIQNQVYALHSSMQGPVTSLYPGDMMMPVECILTEDPVESVSKKAKLSPSAARKTIDVPTKSKSSENSKSSLHAKIRDAMNDTDEEDCDKPLASFLGHPNDRILKQQICDIVEQTDLQDITINTVIQKIFNMYPNYDLNYRKEYIKSTLRSVLYRLGDQKNPKDTQGQPHQDSPDCSVSTTFLCENPDQSESQSLAGH